MSFVSEMKAQTRLLAGIGAAPSHVLKHQFCQEKAMEVEISSELVTKVDIHVFKSISSTICCLVHYFELPLLFLGTSGSF
jgi:hypothetical protein